MKKHTVFLIYIGIICCLVFITSATYTLVNTEEEVVINNNEVKIQLLEARYVDTSNISLVNSRVGDSLTKVFYVKNVTDNDLYYNINLVDVANSFVNKEELVFSLKSDNGAYIKEKVVPSTNTTIASYVKIGKNEEHKYILNIDFLNTGKDQFENELKTFFAKLNIVTSSDVFETYSENSLYKIIENSSYGNEGLIYGDTTMSGLVFSTNTTTNGETVYIYRGSREINNNLVVADKCYKIISTTDSFDVKAIYNGNFIDGKCNDNNVLVEKSNQFNKNSNYNAYVGYMYGSASSGDYVNEHANMSSSSIKIFLDSWYNTNLSDYSNYISNNGSYCANRKTAEFNYNKVDFDKNGFGNSNSGYTPMNRHLNNSYSLICEYENDRFSVLEMYGNGELSNSIGLITLDELFYTGFLKDPKNNYLYTNDSYWTMSPAYFLNGNAYNFVVNKNNITQLNVSKESGIRPVITLKGNIDVLEGNGSIDNPYVITK